MKHHEPVNEHPAADVSVEDAVRKINLSDDGFFSAYFGYADEDNPGGDRY